VSESRPQHGLKTRATLKSLLPSFAVFLTIVAPCVVRADQLLAHGTADMFWIARVVEPAPGAEDQLRTIIRGRGVGSDAHWADVGQLASRVTSVAHRGNQLAALLDTGEWMLLWPGGSAVGAQPAGEGARLLALASNDDSIFAIARTGKPPASGAPATEPTQNQHPEGLALYRLDRGQWTPVAPLTAQVTEGDLARGSFAVIGPVPTIAVLRLGGTVETFTYQPVDATWDAMTPLAAPDAAVVKLLRSEGERPILWLVPETGAGRVHVAAQRAWGAPRELRTREQLPAGAPRTVAWAGGSIRLLFIRDRATFEQAFSDTGEPRTAAAPLRMASSTTTNSLPGRIVTLAAAAMLLMVVLSGMRRAGTSADDGAAALAPPRVVPAPLLPRLLAGLIDAAPLGAACWVIFRNVDLDTQTVDDMLRRTSQPFYFALGGYLLYTWLAELIFARTIGKALLGLRVASLDGSRPGPVETFARNALRIVDVIMLGVPLLLVVLSPLRQRVGDIAARTTVVRSGSRKAGVSSERPPP
jgi:uncharacterized RDD family membrane protein YckC